MRLDESRLNVLTRHVTLIEKSQASGNAALADLIAAKSLVFEAEIAKIQSETNVLRAQSTIQQALGVWPGRAGQVKP